METTALSGGNALGLRCEEVLMARERELAAYLRRMDSLWPQPRKGW
jgi:hypothetical protein